MSPGRVPLGQAHLQTRKFRKPSGAQASGKQVNFWTVLNILGVFPELRFQAIHRLSMQLGDP